MYADTNITSLTKQERIVNDVQNRYLHSKFTKI